MCVGLIILFLFTGILEKVILKHKAKDLFDIELFHHLENGMTTFTIRLYMSNS